MQFSTLSAIALFTVGALAVPAADVESRNIIEARVDCGRIVPACAGGNIVGQTNCRCKGQRGPCDVWTCPGGDPNVNLVSF